MRMVATHVPGKMNYLGPRLPRQATYRILVAVE